MEILEFIFSVFSSGASMIYSLGIFLAVVGFILFFNNKSNPAIAIVGLLIGILGLVIIFFRIRKDIKE